MARIFWCSTSQIHSFGITWVFYPTCSPNPLQGCRPFRLKLFLQVLQTQNFFVGPPKKIVWCLIHPVRLGSVRLLGLLQDIWQFDGCQMTCRHAAVSISTSWGRKHFLDFCFFFWRVGGPKPPPRVKGSLPLHCFDCTLAWTWRIHFSSLSHWPQQRLPHGARNHR